MLSYTNNNNYDNYNNTNSLLVVYKTHSMQNVYVYKLKVANQLNNG